MKKQQIVIIGAGSTGLSTALELAKADARGEREITVLDKGYVGSGQTSKSCGFVRMFYNAPQMIRSAQHSMREIRKICETDPRLRFVQTGLLVLDNQAHRGQIQDNVDLLTSLGVAASYLEGDGLQALHPALRTEDTVAGLDLDAGYVDPQRIASYLEIECKRRGVTIREQTKVTGIRARGGLFHLTTTQGSLVADKLFNATAGYTNQINRMLGIELPVTAIAVNNTFYRFPLALSGFRVAVADFVHGFYTIPREDFVDVSAITLDLARQVDPERQETPFDPTATQEYLSLLSRRVKGAERSSSLGGFGSHIDITPDYYPIISAIDEIPNYFCAAGFSGTGFKHFPMIGTLMRDLILDRDPAYPELAAFFRYDRFDRQDVRLEVRDSYFVKDVKDGAKTS